MTIDSRIYDLFNSNAPFRLEEAWPLMLVKTGSHASGVHVPKPDKVRDVDCMGVVIPPASYVFGLKRWTEEGFQAKVDELDVTFYTVRHFMQLAANCNPNVLPVLWTSLDQYDQISGYWKLVLDCRVAFASRRVLNTFMGFAGSLAKKMENFDAKKMGEKRRQLVEVFGYDTHNACHAIRTLRMGCEFLETGIMQVYREVDAVELCDIKAGKWSLAEVKREIEKLQHRAKLVEPYSKLPANVDFDAIDRLTQTLHTIIYRN